MKLLGSGQTMRVAGRNELMRLLLRAPQPAVKVPLLKRLLALVVRP